MAILSHNSPKFLYSLVFVDLAGSSDFFFFNVAVMSMDAWGFEKVMKKGISKKGKMS